MSEPIEKKNASDHMTNEEIIVRYRQAKDKTEQVKILADLNACTTDKIINILVNEGGYKIQHFNKLIRKLNNGGKTVPNKKKYKKPEIITEEKAVELEKSAAEEATDVLVQGFSEAAKKAGESLKQIVDKVPAILTGKTEDDLAADKKFCKDCDVYDKILQRCKIVNSGYSPDHVCDVSEGEIEAIKPLLATDSENLDAAIEIISQEIIRIDTEIARLKGLKKEILTRCEGAVPF